jgi:hypothetical protein
LRGSAVPMTFGGGILKLYVALTRGDRVERVRLFLWVINMDWFIKLISSVGIGLGSWPMSVAAAF